MHHASRDYIGEERGQEFQSPTELEHKKHGAGMNESTLLFKVVVTVCLVICGAGMTLLIKVQDEHCIRNCTDPHSIPATVIPTEGFSLLDSGDGEGGENFHQPFIQLFQMGLGQLCSIFAFYQYKSKLVPPQPPPPWVDFVPSAAAASLFDAFAEVFVILGLTATSASTAEMMKATLVVFCGLFSIYFFPGFRLTRAQIIATCTMIIGASLVIIREYIGGSSAGAMKEVVGALLVLVAQLCYAGQFVVEERVVDRSKLRHQHVNKALLVFFEGVVSILMALILQLPWTYLHARTDNPWGDFAEDLAIYFTDPVLWGCGIGLSFAVAGFDLFGLATAETMGSDRRAVITASFQVVIVWTISLAIGMETFHKWNDMMAVAGFIVIFLSGLYYAYGSDVKDVPRDVSGAVHNGTINSASADEYAPLVSDIKPIYT